ncbi:MAG: glycoside hydrolase family 127 protein [Akkermansiaceae bacterium]|nr:glycoside hydrolase family 127 protein [Akkermansiaceae bacterium]
MTTRQILLPLLLATLPLAAQTRDYPIQPVPFTSVSVDDAFWSPRMKTNRETTVGYCFDKCEETGRIANFEVAGGLKKGGFQGIYFNDSDVVKVIEGAAYTLAIHPDPKLDKFLDDLISKIAAAQEDDGYLYTARTIADPNYKYPGSDGARWSHLDHGHELYNVGHMYEAAVAHWRVTGKRSFLDVAIKNADLVCKVFGPGPDQHKGVPGHEEIEIGLVKLYRATGDEKYLRQAKHFIDMRGREDLRGKVYGTYAQDHQPLVDQTEAVGHAVRGGYLYAGVADVAAITGDKGYIAAIDRIWEDVISKKLYLIGSVGQHGAGEGYAGPYQLSNLRAYNETCAAIALALWNHRMFLLHGDSKYADVLERIIYNGFLSGVAMTGDKFFYPNPLACDMSFKFNQGGFERSPWFGCSCCPVNVVRFIPSIPGYVYAVRGDSLYVNLYLGGEGKAEVAGHKITIKQQTGYPWDGAVKLTVTPEKAAAFSLRLRVPGWLNEPLPSDLYHYLPRKPSGLQIRINGKPAEPTLEHGYWVLNRTWKPGDTVETVFPMQVRRVLCNEKVEDNRGRIAIERGPLVYCVEGADHDGKVLDLFLEDDVELTPEPRPDLLGGVTVLTGSAKRAHRKENNTPASRPAKLTMIPYYSWCHRGANEMAVWLPRSSDKAQVPPLPTGR